jgi:hypothetical protein
MANNAEPHDPKKDPKRRAKSKDLLICCHMMHNFIFLSAYILFIIITPNAQLSPNWQHVDMLTQIFELDSTNSEQRSKLVDYIKGDKDYWLSTQLLQTRENMCIIWTSASIVLCEHVKISTLAYHFTKFS